VLVKLEQKQKNPHTTADMLIFPASKNSGGVMLDSNAGNAPQAVRSPYKTVRRRLDDTSNDRATFDAEAENVLYQLTL